MSIQHSTSAILDWLKRSIEAKNYIEATQWYWRLEERVIELSTGAYPVPSHQAAIAAKDAEIARLKARVEEFFAVYDDPTTGVDETSVALDHLRAALNAPKGPTT